MAEWQLPVEVNIIDLKFGGVKGRIGVYLLETEIGLVLIEAGPASTLDSLEAGLASRGHQLSDISDVFVTHIHLDHAGSCGWLAEQGCRIHVHEFGAKHLSDPTRLMESVRRIYGKQTDLLWGEVKPVPEALICPVSDGDVFDLGNASLKAYETPGHARHHHALLLDDGHQRSCFTGDAAAMLIPAYERFILLPTPPPEFDLEAWLASLELLERIQAEAYFLTHFGEVEDPKAHFQWVREAILAHSSFIAERVQQQMSLDEIMQVYQPWFQSIANEAGVESQTYDANVHTYLIRMNVVGIMRYLDKKQEREKQH